MRLIVTTTDSIEGCRIVEYIDVLRSSVVVGNDIALSDLFGGNRNYNNRLNDIYDKAMQGLRLKASIAGADAVVGLHTDFEEIFGKGKTRMVVSMVGTAVKLDCQPKCLPEDKKNASVSMDTLHRQYLLVSMRKKLDNSDYSLNEDDWGNILKYSLTDLAPLLYNRYLVVSTQTISNIPLSERKLLQDNFIPFIQSMDFDEAVEVVYSDLETAPECSSVIIRDCNLFAPSKIVGMLEAEHKHIIISLLKSDKPIYTAEDLAGMERIVEFLDNLPDTGYYIEGRGGVFSKTGTLLVCERGHKSAVELGGHCSELLEGSGAVCNLNVKGITEAEVAAIASFKEKVEVLRAILNRGL